MIRAFAILLATTAHPALAQENGRYAVSTNGDAVGVWIVDTQTGEAKYCWPTRLNDRGIKINCTASTK